MPPALPTDPGSVLAQSAAAAAASDLSQHSLAIIAAAVAILCMVIVAVYLHQLNNQHARLLGHLENELAERRKAEEKLRASEGFYHSLVESLPAAILRKDLEGRSLAPTSSKARPTSTSSPARWPGSTSPTTSR